MSSHTLHLLDAEAPKSWIVKLEVSANNVVHQDSSRNIKVVMKFTQQNSPGHIAMSKGNIVR